MKSDHCPTCGHAIYEARDREIVEAYVDDKKTLAQIAADYDLTKERVRQVLESQDVERRRPGRPPGTAAK